MPAKLERSNDLQGNLVSMEVDIVVSSPEPRTVAVVSSSDFLASTDVFIMNIVIGNLYCERLRAPGNSELNEACGLVKELVVRNYLRSKHRR